MLHTVSHGAQTLTHPVSAWFRHDDLSNCLRYAGVREDPKHVMFHCTNFAMEPKNLKLMLGREVSPEMLKSKEN